MAQAQFANPGIDADIRTFVGSTHAQQIDPLCEPVRVPSDNPSGDCAPYAAHAKALLETLGLTVEAHAVPQAQVRTISMVGATNLIVRHTFGNGGPTVAMNAHDDVVPLDLNQTYGLYGGEVIEAEHDPIMFGRGMTVSELDFTAYTQVLLTLIEVEKRGAELNGTIELHFTYDGEIGGDVGPRQLFDQGLSKFDYMISVGLAYSITSAHNGCLHVKVTMRGKQTHAVMPYTGTDAIEVATHVLQAAYAYRVELVMCTFSVPGIDHAMLNVGLIQDGINTNVALDLVTFRVGRRIIPEEAGCNAEDELRAVIKHAAIERSEIEVAVEHIPLAQSFARLSDVNALIGALRRNALAVFGGGVPVHGMLLYTDARHYTAYGVPAVLYGAGPWTSTEARGRNTDGNLWSNDLQDATIAVGCAVGELLGG